LLIFENDLYRLFMSSALILLKGTDNNGLPQSSNHLTTSAGKKLLTLKIHQSTKKYLSLWFWIRIHLEMLDLKTDPDPQN